MSIRLVTYTEIIFMFNSTATVIWTHMIDFDIQLLHAPSVGACQLLKSNHICTQHHCSVFQIKIAEKGTTTHSAHPAFMQ